MADAGPRSCHCRAVDSGSQVRIQFRFILRSSSGKLGRMTSTAALDSLDSLDSLSPEAQRALAAELIVTVGKRDRELVFRQTRIDQLTHELALLKRFRFGRSSEQLDSGQASLLEESVEADLAAIEVELDDLQTDSPERKPRSQPKRAALPASLPRTDIHHEPDCWKSL